MAIKHQDELRAFAQRAAKLAQLIHQEWGSAVEGGGQVRVNVIPPTHGPDQALQKVEGLLGDVVAAIEAYLRPPPAG